MASPFKQAWIILKGEPVQCPQCGGEAQRINEGDLADPGMMADLDKHGIEPHNVHSIICNDRQGCGFDQLDI